MDANLNANANAFIASGSRGGGSGRAAAEVERGVQGCLTLALSVNAAVQQCYYGMSQSQKLQAWCSTRP